MIKYWNIIMNIETIAHIFSFMGVCVFFCLIYKKIFNFLGIEINKISQDKAEIDDKIKALQAKLTLYENNLKDVKEKCVISFLNEESRVDEFVKNESEKMDLYYTKKKQEIERLIKNLETEQVSIIQKQLISSAFDEILDIKNKSTKVIN